MIGVYLSMTFNAEFQAMVKWVAQWSLLPEAHNGHADYIFKI